MTDGIPYQFGSYTFPDTVDLFQDNFANTTPKTIRLARMDGGFNEDRNRPAPTVVGNVQVGFYLVPDDPTALDTLRDQVNEMVDWGMQQLWYRPSDGGADRYCWAMVNNIVMPRTREAFSDVYQKVALYFHVPFPRWISTKYTGWKIGDGTLITAGGSVKIGSGGYVVNASGLTTNATLPYDGNAEGIVVAAIEPQTGQSCTNPIIQRLDGNVVVDEVRYTGSLTAGQILVIDPWRESITKQGSAVWNNVQYMDIAFLRITKAARAFRIKFAAGGNAARVTFYYDDLYR